MRFAIINNKKQPPVRGLTGNCPSCGGQMIAKCGAQRVHHWAHQGERHCDRWWEPETEWHRSWKMNFPDDWQEVLHFAPCGEKHIADVKTPQGLIIEFQHSHLGTEERAARENFYGTLVWVINGLRLKGDLPRFVEGARALRPTDIKDIYAHCLPKKIFPKNWLESKVPVFLDFGIRPSPDPYENILGQFLWCLLPQRIHNQVIIRSITRKDFIQLAQESSHELLGQNIPLMVEGWLEYEHEKREQAIIQQQREMIARSRYRYYNSRRRY